MIINLVLGVSRTAWSYSFLEYDYEEVYNVLMRQVEEYWEMADYEGLLDGWIYKWEQLIPEYRRLLLSRWKPILWNSLAGRYFYGDFQADIISKMKWCVMLEEPKNLELEFFYNLRGNESRLGGGWAHELGSWNVYETGSSSWYGRFYANQRYLPRLNRNILLTRF